MGDRVILHSDINCCYASIEHLHHPELAGKPLAVGGDPEARHGIVLTADYTAKKYGVKTGMALWQAKQVCPDITFVSPRCANGTCCKPSKKKEQKLPTECVGCPYYRGNGYCFPCMRKLIGK